VGREEEVGRLSSLVKLYEFIMPFIILIDFSIKGPRVGNAINRLLQLTRNNHAMSSGRVVSLESFEAISAAIPGWPHWSSGPTWMIFGTYDMRASAVVQTPLGDTAGGEFDRHCDSLLSQYDWAIFPYFKTFHDGWHTLITKDSAIHSEMIDLLPPRSITQDYPDAATRHEHLRFASFTDYHVTGAVVFRSTLDKPNVPLLLCSTVDSDEIDANQVAEYNESLGRLDLVAEFSVKRKYNVMAKYTVYRITDEAACLRIWARSSCDDAIALAMMSSNTNLDRLKKLLQREPSGDAVRFIKGGISDWAYSLVYGGGSDEYHALFAATDSKVTQRVWECVQQSTVPRKAYPMSRF
jgi:hypothetical protein